MIHRLGVVTLIGVFCLATVLPSTVAAEEGLESPAPTAGQVTQGELACMLVHVLGLAPFVPSSPSSFDCISALVRHGIVPPGGWKANQVVRRGDLACILVRCLGYEGEISKDKRDDTEECIGLLNQMGIDLSTVGSAIDAVDPLAEKAPVNVADVTSDPARKKHKHNPTDEPEGVPDMAFVVRLLSEFELLFGGELRPITPD